MPADTHSDLQQAAQRLRDALELRTEEASSQITRSWLVAQQRIDLEVQTLLSKMEAARLAGIEPSPAWLYQQRRLAALTDAIQEQVADWARTTEPAIRDLAYAAAAQASEGARDLAREAARVDLPGVEASFTDLAPENMAAILGHLAPGGPLRDLLVSLGPETAEAAAQTLLQGVLLGKGSAWITRGLAQALDVPRWRAETIARTEALRAFRETSRETYKKSNVVGQWEWNAALDRRTCPACVALHGSLFSLEERLDGHPRCRCAMVPVTKTWAELGMDPALDEMNPRVPTETGPEWLKRQAPQTQRAVLGPGKYDLYANGKADLPDFVARTHNDRWGTMRRERSLRELAEGRNADYRDVTPEQAPRDVTPEPATSADPFAGVSDDQLRERIGSGSMADRRAAQSELVRRKSEEAIRKTAERRALLDRYAGDGTTWTQVPGLAEPTWQRGRHTVTVGDDLGDELEGFLDDVAATLDKMPADLRPITVRVPYRDRVFGGRGTGITGGYVTEGLDFVNINPVVARGLDIETESKLGQFMPGSADVTLRQWTIAHELGHILDHGHGHTHDAKAAGQVFRRLKTALSRYGKSNRAEGYAEAWAQWLHGGPGSSPVADAYAEEYGWTR